MKNRYRLLYRGERGTFFCFDNVTRKRTGLQTKDRDAAEQIVLAKNQALRQPVLNLQIAKAYLAGTDNGVTTRTWQNAIEALINTKRGANRHRWTTAAKDKAQGQSCRSGTCWGKDQWLAQGGRSLRSLTPCHVIDVRRAFRNASRHGH